MSQSRKFKVTTPGRHGVGDNLTGPKLSISKSAKELQSISAKRDDCCKRRNAKKIPKSLRYDLESALVDLCDVWFEKIKPHLVQNNIKLHVYNPDGVDSASASGDFEHLPPVTITCSHNDRGAPLDSLRQKYAFCVDASTMQPQPPTPSEAPYYKPQVSIKPRKRLSHEPRVRKPHPKSDAPVSSKIKHKSQPLRVSRLCQACPTTDPMTEPSLLRKDVQIRNLFKSVFNQVPICPPTSPNGATQRSKKIVSMGSQTVSSNAEKQRSLLKHLHYFNRPRANTSSSENKTHQSWLNLPILFQNDLIDIIGKRNDEILKDIGNSQAKKGYPSMVNLISHRNVQKNNSSKKYPPWR